MSFKNMIRLSFYTYSVTKMLAKTFELNVVYLMAWTSQDALNLLYSLKKGV